MRKQQMYGKTTRFNNEKVLYYLHEKIDGNNLGIAKIGNELTVCQRNNIIKDFDEITYGGLLNIKMSYYNGLMIIQLFLVNG